MLLYKAVKRTGMDRKAVLVSHICRDTFFPFYISETVLYYTLFYLSKEVESVFHFLHKYLYFYRSKESVDFCHLWSVLHLVHHDCWKCQLNYLNDEYYSLTELLAWLQT